MSGSESRRDFGRFKRQKRMSRCVIQLSPDISKEGKALYYDRETNRLFVECEDAFKWYPINEVHMEEKLDTVPGWAAI